MKRVKKNVITFMTLRRGRKEVSRKEVSFTMPSHAFLFTKLSLHHFINIFLLNK